MGPHCQDRSYLRGRADLACGVADRACQEAKFGTANSPSATTARATVPAQAGATRARGRWAVLGLPRHSRPGWRKLLAVAGRQGEHRSTLQDPGCYEERYRLTGQAAAGLAIFQYIAVQRREEAAPPPPDGAIPAPGRATPAAHKITGWRLDRERFAAVAAAVAPGVPIVEASRPPPGRAKRARLIRSVPRH